MRRVGSPGRPASDATHLARLVRIARKFDREAGELLAAMIRQMGDAKTCTRLNINRTSLPWVRSRAGVKMTVVIYGLDEEIVVVRRDGTREVLAPMPPRYVRDD